MKYVEEKELARTLFVKRAEIMTKKEATFLPGFESYDDEYGIAIFKDVYNDIKKWLAVISNPAHLYNYAGLEIKGDGARMSSNIISTKYDTYKYPGIIPIYWEMSECEFSTTLSAILYVYASVHVYYDIHDTGAKMSSKYTNHSDNIFYDSDDCELCDHQNCIGCHKVYVVRDKNGRLYEGDDNDAATSLLHSRMLNYRQDIDDIEEKCNRRLRKPTSQFVTLSEFTKCLDDNDILYSIS